MNSWKDDKRWSDRFLPEIKRILGELLIAEAPTEEDRDHNTDLIVLRMDSVRIACRIRRYEYLLTYPNDITIRRSRPSGKKSELSKIIEGWGNYMFYGFADRAEKELAQWRVLSLNAFRLWLGRSLVKNHRLPGTQKMNHDGSSDFIAFPVADMPRSVVVESKLFTEATT